MGMQVAAPQPPRGTRRAPVGRTHVHDASGHRGPFEVNEAWTVTAGKFVGESLTATNISVTVLSGNCFTPVTKAELTADIAI